MNTASREVLMTLPRVDAAAANAIIRGRRSGQGAYTGVGELYTRGLLTEDQWREVFDRVMVRSNVFEITSTGRTPGRIERTIHAVVDRSEEVPRVLYWYESE